MRNDIVNFLELQDYIVEQVSMEKNEKLIIRVHKKKCFKVICKKCDLRSVSVHQYGDWKRKKHGQFQEHLLYVEVKRHRYRCLKCNHVFSEELPHIPLCARHTENFKTASLKYLSKNSFREVCGVYQTGYGSLKKNLYAGVDPMNLSSERMQSLIDQKEIYLGIDGQSFRGLDMVLTIADVVKRNPITILPSEHQKDLDMFIATIPLEIREKVKGVAIDMTRKQLRVIKRSFPHALIVIDHYHVVADALRHVHKMRRILQQVYKESIPLKKEIDKNYEDLTIFEKQKLKNYFKRFPGLEAAYKIKELIRALYRRKSYEEAVVALQDIKSRLLACRNMNMREFHGTLCRWEKEILNYFLCPISNGYTEGLHTKCKLIKRKSYGFRNVQTYVRKLLLGILPFATFYSFTHLLT